MSSTPASFIAKFIGNPGRTGAIAPATDALARAVADVVMQLHREAGDDVALKVIELGAGTGALSRRLSELRPVLVEQDTDWAGLLQQKFPSLDVRAECATRTLEALDHPCGLVLSIPLLNNPQAETLRALIEERRAEGWVRFCVLYTYGGRDPLSGAGFRRRERAAFVVRNLPPAWVWAYS